MVCSTTTGEKYQCGIVSWGKLRIIIMTINSLKLLYRNDNDKFNEYIFLCI